MPSLAAADDSAGGRRRATRTHSSPTLKESMEILDFIWAAFDDARLLFQDPGDVAVPARTHGSCGRHEMIITKKLSIGECVRRIKELADSFEPDDFHNPIEFL